MAKNTSGLVNPYSGCCQRSNDFETRKAADSLNLQSAGRPVGTLHGSDACLRSPSNFKMNHGLLMHGLVEDDEPGPTDRLGLKHRRRGVTQQMLPISYPGMTTRDTDVSRQEHFAAFQRERPRKFLLQGGQPLVSHYRAALTLSSRKVNSSPSILATVSADRILRRHPLADLNQESIGKRWPQTLWRTIRKPSILRWRTANSMPRLTPALQEHTIQSIKEQCSIGKAGQRIVERFQEQALFGSGASLRSDVFVPTPA